MKPGDICNAKHNIKDRKWRYKEAMTSQGGGESNPSVLGKPKCLVWKTSQSTWDTQPENTRIHEN